MTKEIQPKAWSLDVGETGRRDSRFPDGQPAQRTITGSGFGPAPNVVLFRHFREGTPGEPVVSAAPEGQIGTLENIDSDRQYASFEGRSVYRGHSAEGTNRTITYVHNSDSRRFYLYYRVGVPDGAMPPGNDDYGHRQWGTDSSAKFAWVMKGNDGNMQDQGTPDTVIGSHVGNGVITVFGGNSLNPSANLMTAGVHWEWDALNGIGAEYNCDFTDPVGNSVTHKATRTNGRIGTQEITHDRPGFSGSDASINNGNAYFDRVKFSGFARPSGGDAQVYFADIYMAVESEDDAGDVYQRLLLTNSHDLTTSTLVLVRPADSWADDEIRFTPDTYEQSVCTHWHVIKPDGSRVWGVL